MIDEAMAFMVTNWGTVAAIGTTIITILAVLSNLNNIIELYKKFKKWINDRKRTPDSGDGTGGFLQMKKTIHNLPPLGKFIGRQDDIRELVECIQKNRMVVIGGGVGGIGKTSLALQAIYKFVNKAKLKKQMFHAVIWVSARDTAININSVLDTIAKVLEYPSILQKDVGEKYYDVLKLFKGKCILLVIDNYETINDTALDRFVNDIVAPSKVLITTRQRRVLSPDQFYFEIKKLTKTDGIDLIRHELKQINHATSVYQTNELERLYDATDGLPLAIKWAIGQINFRGQSIVSIISMINEAKGDIFEMIFTKSWNMLHENSKHLLHTALFFETTISRESLFATTGLGASEFNEALGQVSELSLLDFNHELSESNKRFNLHPLTRSFIKKETDVDEQVTQKIYENMARYYLTFCNERCKKQNGIVSYDEIDFELPNILKVIRMLSKYSKTSEYNELISEFSDLIHVFLWSRGYWSDRIEICKLALNCNELFENWLQAGKQAYYIGCVYFWRGNYEESEKWAVICKNFFDKTNDDDIEKKLLDRLTGFIAGGKKNYYVADEKLQNVLNSLTISEHSEHIDKNKIAVFSDWVMPGADGYKSGIVSILTGLGIVANRNNEFKVAVEWLKKAIDLASTIKADEGLAVASSHLGHAFLGLNELKEAEKNFIFSLELAKKVQRKSTIARCYHGLAKVENQRGNKRNAERHCREAINLFERLGMLEELEELKEIFHYEL